MIIMYLKLSNRVKASNNYGSLFKKLFIYFWLPGSSLLHVGFL